jgi:rod shape-determining protein MreC
VIRFFKSHRFKILIAIIALLFGMMLYSASGDGIANIPRNLLEMVTTPLQQMTAAVSRGVDDFFGVFINAKKNAVENEQLRAQLAEYNQALIDYEKLKDENEQLKQAVGIKDLYPDFEMTIASVVSRDPADRYGSFILDKGTLNGVSQGDPVMTANGLVGVVTKTGLTSARVQTVLSPEVNVSVLEISTKELGVVQGDVKLSQEGLTKMSILSSETEIQPGALIITAGASGAYPKGLPLGTVKEVAGESHGVTKYAVIQPLEPVDKVDTVMVVTDFLGQGSQPVD